jgi:RNA polymerase sigma-70 factor (ECF subfamily)
MTRRAEVELSVDLQDAGNEEAVTGGIDLAKLLTALKPAQQEVIHLVKIRGLSIEEASMKTGQSVSLVKINIHRGLMKAVMAARDDPALAAAK